MNNRFWSKVDIRGPDECWPWTAAVRRKDEGYGAFYLDGRHQPASRVAWMLRNGPVPDGMVVCHSCDNPACVNPAHLWVGLPQDNDADRVRKGRQARGSRNGYAKTTERIVWAVRKLRAFGVKRGEVARLTNLTPSHVSELMRKDRQNWRHIDDAAMANAVRAEWRRNASV